MHLQIITTEKELFKGDVKRVQVPGTLGPFTMLKNHAPIISTLTSGKIKVVKENDEEEVFEVKSGVVENSDNAVTVLVDA